MPGESLQSRAKATEEFCEELDKCSEELEKLSGKGMEKFVAEKEFVEEIKKFLEAMEKFLGELPSKVDQIHVRLVPFAPNISVLYQFDA